MPSHSGDGEGVRGQRVVLVALAVVVVLIAIGLSVEQRLRADFEVLDRAPTTGTDLGDELPQPQLMPAPPPVPEGDRGTGVDSVGERSGASADARGEAGFEPRSYASVMVWISSRASDRTPRDPARRWRAPGR